MKLSDTALKDDDVIALMNKAITESITESISKKYDLMIESFKKTAEDERDKVIAGAVMKISTWYNFQDLGHTLRIEVKKPEA